MANEKYNGWTNRETWLVNMYFSEMMSEFIEDRFNEDTELGEALEVIQANEFADEQNKREYIGEVLADIARMCEEYFDEFMYEETSKFSTFISDFIDFGRIDWYDIADSIYREIV